MGKLDQTTILRRSIHGVLALSVRTLFIQAVGLVSTFLLTIFLDPTAFGVFFIVSAAIAFLVYFSDIGLAAALIQKKEDITSDDLKTAFTIQQMLVLTIVIVALLLSNVVSSFYNLEKAGLFLFQALVISFFLSSLKTIPSVILERNLNFKKLVVPQFTETIAFNLTAVVLAIQGFGVTSFTAAVLARGIVGVVTMYLISPWRPLFGISNVSAKKLLSYGLPFQTNSMLALVKDDFLTIILGKILTFGEVGFVGFAQKWAYMPLRLAMDNIIRITFPSFSRLQEDQKFLRRALEKSLFLITVFVTPLLVGLVILSPYLITIIPKYAKWEPALVSLGFFAANALLSSISTPLTNFLNAIGKIKITLMLMVFWTAATWIATLLAIKLYGFSGVSIAAFVVSLSVFAVVIITKRYIDFAIIKSVGPSVFAGFVMGVFLYKLAPTIIRDLPSLLLMIIVSGIIYLGVLYVVARSELRADITLMIRILRNE